MIASNRVLHIDIETYSEADLSKVGLYRYADDPSFEVLLFAYAFDDEAPEVIDLAMGEEIPRELEDALYDPGVTKVAHNAAFERICLSKHFGHFRAPLDPSQWHCTMVHALMLGLPASLSDVGEALGLPENKQKLSEGKRLVNYFCKPCKPTKANGGRTRNYYFHDIDKWDRFMRYNLRDVVAEQEIYRRLQKHPIPASEMALYALDQRINDRGIPLDKRLLTNVLEYAPKHSDHLATRCADLTDGININAISALRGWVGEHLIPKRELTALTKDDVDALLEGMLPPRVREVLELRKEAGKTSVRKYDACARAMCSDGRIHGALQFYGAGRTGRWAGRIIQPQNFPRGSYKDIELARELVLEKSFEDIDILYGSINNVFATLIRTLIKADKGWTLAVADYSAIEARVIAWFADEKWRMDVFIEGGDIYCMSASQMFGVPVVKHGVNGHLRQKGKIAELACGYGGGVGALKAMGASDMGLTDDEMQDIVNRWRDSSPHIVNFWREVERSARRALSDMTRVSVRHGVSFEYRDGMLLMNLPSGRSLAYMKPMIDREGNLTYKGVNQTTRRIERIKTWGGKLVENLVQAFARDCLAVALMRLDEAGYRIIFHVHDEVVAEVRQDEASKALAEMEHIMAKPIDWAPGLILTADGFTSDYYRKD